MICAICLNGIDHGSKCAGWNCTAIVGACCYEDPGLCVECAAESAKLACPPLSSELIAILLSGSVLAGKRMPLVSEPICDRTGDATADCPCVEIDEVADHA